MGSNIHPSYSNWGGLSGPANIVIPVHANCWEPYPNLIWGSFVEAMCIDELWSRQNQLSIPHNL